MEHYSKLFLAIFRVQFEFKFKSEYESVCYFEFDFDFQFKLKFGFEDDFVFFSTMALKTTKFRHLF